MFRSLHYETGEPDRIFDIADESDRTGLFRMAVHYRRVHLVLAIVRENRTAARIEKREIFELTHCGINRVQRVPVCLKHCPTGTQCILDAGSILGFEFGRHFGSKNRTGSTVDS